MSTLSLNIVTPGGISYHGEAKSVLVHTTEGDICILPNHSNYVATLEIGRVKITTETGVRSAACSGGFISVAGKSVNIVAATFEYADEIDLLRAQKAKERAEKILADQTADKDIRLAEMKLKRALNRIKIAENR